MLEFILALVRFPTRIAYGGIRISNIRLVTFSANHSLSVLENYCERISTFFIEVMEPPTGIEPTTFALRDLGVVEGERNLSHAHMSVESALMEVS